MFTNILLFFLEKKKFKLVITIRKSNPDSAPIFTDADIELSGPLETILHESIINVFREKLQSLRYEEDYEIESDSCTFSTIPEANRTSIKFKLTAYKNKKEPFPAHLSKSKDPATIKYQQEFKSIVEKAIADKYGIKVTVYIQGWRFGSIVIEGIVSTLSGTFSEKLKSNILLIIKDRAKILFDCSCTEISEISTITTEKSSSIDFAVVITASFYLFSKIKKNDLLNDFLKKINNAIRNGK